MNEIVKEFVADSKYGFKRYWWILLVIPIFILEYRIFLVLLAIVATMSIFALIGSIARGKDEL
jgi:hypothetical protein